MNTHTSTKTDFDKKLARLNDLTAFVEKTTAAMLGEEPQMRKELGKVKKIAIAEMTSLNAQLKQMASELKTEK